MPAIRRKERSGPGIVISAGGEGIGAASGEGCAVPAASKLTGPDASDGEVSAPQRVPGRQKHEAIKRKTDTQRGEFIG